MDSAEMLNAADSQSKTTGETECPRTAETADSVQATDETVEPGLGNPVDSGNVAPVDSQRSSNSNGGRGRGKGRAKKGKKRKKRKLREERREKAKAHFEGTCSGSLWGSERVAPSDEALECASWAMGEAPEWHHVHASGVGQACVGMLYLSIGMAV